MPKARSQSPRKPAAPANPLDPDQLGDGGRSGKPRVRRSPRGRPVTRSTIPPVARGSKGNSPTPRWKRRKAPNGRGWEYNETLREDIAARASFLRALLAKLPLVLLLLLVALPLRANDNPQPGAPQDTDSMQQLLTRIATSARSSAAGIVFTNPSTAPYRNTALSSTPVVAKASAGTVYAWNITNPNSVPVYLKVYDSPAPTVGTTTPTLVYSIPANGGLILPRTGFPHVVCQNAVTLAAVTGLADNSTAAPATGLFVQVAISQ